MSIRIALAGNPNCGKTTLFNALTGSNQFVGNWPGVTVEKKEGLLKGREDVILTDLPGIYSLSPYTPEEIVARNYLIDERPDAILNIVDGTNLERNLYLTTQLIEVGVPVVIAINMMDIVRKLGDSIDIDALGKAFGCPVFEISALKSDGIDEAIEASIRVAQSGGGKSPTLHMFSGVVEHALAHIEEAAVHGLPSDEQRWYSIKIFERDSKVLSKLGLDPELLSHIEEDICLAEQEMDDDAESIIINERYNYVDRKLKGVYKKKHMNRQSASDKIDRVLTNRFLALPIFALIMFLVYFVSVTTVGTIVTDFTNDGLFGDGWHLLGIGNKEYASAVEDHAKDFFGTELIGSELLEAHNAGVPGADLLLEAYEDSDFLSFAELYETYGAAIEKYAEEAITSGGTYLSHILISDIIERAPVSSDYGVWVPGIGVLISQGLEAINCAPWLESLVVDGIVGGVGAVLGFVPQMLVLFLFLAFLEACGYMSRIAFVMDRLFVKVGLSGKSFIPLLIGTGCSVPGIMASRTIENEPDRRMTVITTSFIPCGAKLPVIALISAAFFGNSALIALSAYLIGMAAVIISGVILKKTKLFAGDPSPFVMEMPPYHMPTLTNLLRSTWERGWSFIKKAGTVILLSSVVIWSGSSFGFIDGAFLYSSEMPLESSLLGYLGKLFSWIFIPLGFGNIKATVATFMGLLAKEEVVAVFGILDFGGMTALSAYSFLLFNLLCAPCVAAMGAIKKEMNSGKWTAFAITYQCVFAYCVSFVVYRLGVLVSEGISLPNAIGGVLAILVILGAAFMMLRPARKSSDLKIKK